MKSTETEVVYIISPDWGCYLFASLHTLLTSGSTFDRIRIFCVGKRPNHWIFNDSRIVVDEVEPLDNNYFLINKTYFTQSQAERAIYLDADTLVLQPLDYAWQGVNTDFIGRTASNFKGQHWNQQKWLSTLQTLGASQTPYFNTGFFIFQNGTHQRLSNLWYDLTQQGLKKELFDPSELHSSRMSEQIALSLAIGSAHLSHHQFSRKEHAYAWKKESYNNVVVYHTGNKGFFKKTAIVEPKMNLNFGSPIAVSKFNQTQLQLQWKLFQEKWRFFPGNIKQKLKSVILGR